MNNKANNIVPFMYSPTKLDFMHSYVYQFIEQVRYFGLSDADIEIMLFHGFCQFAARESAEEARRTIAGYAVEFLNAEILDDGRVVLPFVQSG